MSKSLNKAIVRRVNGTEDLSAAYDEVLAAQTLLRQWPIRYGVTSSDAALPSTTFVEDAGTLSLGGEAIGQIDNSIYRFEGWTRERAGDWLPSWADAVERLFNERRGAPPLTLDNGRVYAFDLFVPFQGPLWDQNINAFFGLIAFRFVEARP